MTPAELLLAAADALAAHEWCQGCNFVDADGNRQLLDWLEKNPDADPVAACAVGAICVVAGDDVDARNGAIDQLEVYLAAGNKDVRPCVATWNDRRGRTKEEVVTAMRRAARN